MLILLIRIEDVRPVLMKQLRVLGQNNGWGSISKFENISTLEDFRSVIVSLLNMLEYSSLCAL